jgi:hypothetical protein
MAGFQKLFLKPLKMTQINDSALKIGHTHRTHTPDTHTGLARTGRTQDGLRTDLGRTHDGHRTDTGRT